MGHRDKLAARVRTFQKGVSLVLLLPFLLQPFAVFAQTTTNSSTAAPTNSSTQTQPTASQPATPNSSSNIQLPIPFTPAATSDSLSGTNTTTATPDTTSNSDQTTSQTPTTQTNNSQTTDQTASAQTASPSTGAQPLLLSASAPGSGAESPDLTRKAIDPKFYNQPDPVTGSLSYTFPIQIPPGRNNIQPDVDLKYSSQPGSNVNLIGYGWDTGIPYIQRLNIDGTNNLYTDTNFYSSVDGQIYQTAASSSTWGARVENGNFNNYQLLGSSSSTQYWVMTDKNGTTYTFGTTTASRLDNPSNNGQIYKWMLEKVQDVNGNYVTYQYAKDLGEIYPSKITYTNASTSPGIFEVDYATTTRNDIATSTASGFSVISEWLIGSIQVKVNGSLYRNYALSYTSGVNGLRSLLTAVQETAYENGTVTLPLTQFSYRTANKGWTPSATSYTPPIPFTASTYLADLNGDGLVDLLYSYQDDASNTAYINTGSQWVASSTWTPPMYFYGSSIDFGARLVDVNGDGLTDIVQSFNNASSTTGVWINNGHGWTASSTWSVPVEFTSSSTNDMGVRFADVNGDGLPDIVQSHDGSSAVYLNNGHGWGSSSWTVPVDFAVSGNDNYVRIEDVNGDGLPDLMQSYSTVSTSSNKVWINNSSGWTLDPQWTIPVKFAEWGTFQGGHQWPDTGVRITDVNGDGLPDIVQAWNQLTDGAQNTYINTGHGWVLDNQWNPPAAVVSDAIDQEVRLADANGDGLLDFIQSYSLDSAYTTYLNNSRTPDLLIKVTYPQGGSANYTYQSSQLYKNGSTLLNPNLPQSIDTVSSIVLDNAAGVVASTSYSYQGGLYNYNGPFDRQFGGFFKVVKTDALGDITNTFYHQGIGTNSSQGEYLDSTPKIGKIYRIENYDNSGNEYSATVNRWTANALSGNRNYVNLTQEVDMTYDASTTHKDKATSYTYDNANGDVLTKTQWGQVTGNQDGSFTDTGTDKFVTTTTYASSTNGVVVPTDSTTVDQSSNKVNEQTNYYDNGALGVVTLGRLTKQSNWISGTSSPIYASSTYSYNSYGLPTSQTDPRGNTTTYGYDTYNLYPATTTNPLSQATYTTYDYGSGQVSTTTDSNGDVFSNEYDGLGRLLQKLQPDNSTASSSALVVATQYVYSDTALPVISKLSNLTTGTSTLTNSYLDGFGRVLQSRTAPSAGFTTITSTTSVPINISYLIVAGGGGGGGGSSIFGNNVGGGGAGGMLTGTINESAGSYTVTIGAGGAGGTTNHAGSQGGNSSALGFTAVGGGGGGGTDSGGTPSTGGSGGSGGGGAGNGNGGNIGSTGGAGTTGQGNAGGGADGCTNRAAGGGGGAGGAGGACSGTGVGGTGLASSITGSSVTYAGGGGQTGAAGGSGGGGAGSNFSAVGTAGSANTGGGGGAGYFTYAGGAGGSGIVIFSYPTVYAGSFTCSGSLTTSGGNTICTYTSSGTFTVISGNGVASTSSTTLSSNGDNIVTDYQYNNLGLLSKESLPYFNNGSAKTAATTNTNLYTNYSYDPIQRVKTITNAVGSTTYAYNQWQTTVTDANNHPKDLTYDAYGNLTQVTEHNSGSAYNTTYVYDGNKNLTKLTDSQGNIRNFTYDGLGRELTSEDLHAATDTTFGKWTYSYDTAGNKTQSIDPNSNTINYTYDGLNRVLTEDYTGQAGTEKTYVYDSCTNGIGHLCSAATASATSTYAYDQLGNTTTENDLITGTSTYTMSSKYDQQGNVTQQTYPDGSIVNYIYNGLGQVSAITEQERGTGSTTPIVNDIEYGPDGQVTYQKNANGTETFNTYNANALYRLTSKKTIGPGIGLGSFTPMAMLQGQQQSMFANASPSNPIEATNLRTDTSQTFVLGKDASGNTIYSTHVFSKPIFSQDTSGNFNSETSLTISPKTNNAWNVSDSDYSAQINTALSSGIFTYTNSGSSLTLSLSDAKANTAVTATEGTGAAANTFTYKNALGTGNNLQVISANNYLQKNVVLTKLPAQPQGATTYDITFKLTGATDIKIGNQTLSTAGTLTSSGQAQILNGSTVVAYIWPPYGYDSSTKATPTSQTPISVTYTTQADGSILITKHIPFSWLSTATFPVHADLTISPNSGIGDGDDQTQPYPSSWSTQHTDTTGRLANYTANDIHVYSAGYLESSGYLVIWRAFFPFDTSALGSTAIIGTTSLNVYVKTVGNDYNDGYNTVNVYKGNEASPTAVINSDIGTCGDATTSPTKGSTDVSLNSVSANGYLTFPLNTTGQSWISKTGYTQLCLREGHDTTNNAINLNASSWKYSGLDMASSEAGTTTAPYLSIYYTLASSTPATSTQLQVDDKTNPSNITTPSPVFSATFNDANAFDVATNYEIQVSTSTSFSNTVWDSGEQSLSPNVYEGNQSQDLTYGGTPLALDSTKYYWRIKFWDAAGTGAWSTGTDYFVMADNGGTLQNYAYTYDAVGNITQIVDSAIASNATTTAYTYDDLNRLFSFTLTNANHTSTTSETFSYDSLGNILTKSDTGTYTYAGNTGASYADPDAVTGITVGTTTATYAYDHNGNLTSGGGISNTFNYDNYLTASTIGTTSVSYLYDVSGARKKMVIGSATTYYPSQYFTQLTSTTSEKDIYANGQLVAMISNKTATSSSVLPITYWSHDDYLGNTNIVSSSTGLTTEATVYYPFGALLTDRTNSKFNESRKYLNQQYDPSTAYSYLNARYYNSGVGRFVSEDPANVQKPIPDFLVSPQLFNLYSYSSNNPIIGKDPTGLFDISSGLIQSGDTLSYIAGRINARYGTSYTPTQLARASGISNINLIYPGQYIRGYLPVSTNNSTQTGNTYAPTGSSGSLSTLGVLGSINGGYSYVPQQILNPQGFTQEGLISQTNNSQLIKMFTQLYRSGSQIEGGTAGAVRQTAMTGELVGGSDHIQKAEDYARGLQNIINNPETTEEDAILAEQVQADLQNSTALAYIVKGAQVVWELIQTDP